LYGGGEPLYIFKFQELGQAWRIDALQNWDNVGGSAKDKSEDRISVKRESRFFHFASLKKFTKYVRKKGGRNLYRNQQ